MSIVFLVAFSYRKGKGYIPGYLSMRIDKLDGHPWMKDEITLFSIEGRETGL
ncbi:hypothetical protein [Dictyobacter kobayashii]|nr:hypothetical protein [Dictyobacter kobayashii]